MKIETVEVGYLNTNCYILEKNNKCLIVDPGDEVNKIIDKIGSKEVLGILLTHSHFDHVGAVSDLEKKYNINTLSFKNLEEKEYQIDCFRFKVIFTPGHSSDSIVFFFEEEQKMFVGDFIFKENIGRCDLPTGDLNVMYKSIDKIKKYENILVFPGHGESTSLEFEKKNNPYF